MHGGHAVHEAVRAFVERRGAWTLAAGPLPSNVLDVLKLAARSGDCLDQWSVDLNIPPQRLAEIAGSFIENVLITPEASHYRVLGVEPDASEARITVHYNWLMKWLRAGGLVPDTRREMAARIQAAYSNLNDATRRAAYDEATRHARAARLEEVLQPSQYDPRGSAVLSEPPSRPAAPPSPEAAAPAPVAKPAGEPPPVAVQPGARAAPRPDTGPDFAETVVLPADSAATCVQNAIELPPRRAMEPEPIRRRWPLAMALLVAAVAIAAFLTKDRWLPRLPIQDAVPVAAAARPAAPPASAPAPTQPVAAAPAAEAAAGPAADAGAAALPEAVPDETAPPVPPPEELPVAEEAPVAVAPQATPEEPKPEPAARPDPVVATAVLQPQGGLQPVPVDPVVPAEARTLARRIGEAYASGDVVTALNFLDSNGQLSPPELAATAAEVERWGEMRPGAPLAVAGTRSLPPLRPGGAARAAVELRAPDDAGLRVILERDGLFWRVERVLSIAPTASRGEDAP